VMNEQIVVADHLYRITIVDGEMRQPRVRGFDDDVGLEPGLAEDPLNSEHFVTDGVAVSERRQDLMNADH
jgi:hypothetical protein